MFLYLSVTNVEEVHLSLDINKYHKFTYEFLEKRPNTEEAIQIWEIIFTQTTLVISGSSNLRQDKI